MAVTVWSGSTYKNARIAPTADGELVSCAIKIGTSPLEVWVRKSTTGGTVWPTTASDGSAWPRLVGNLGSSTGKVCNIHLKKDGHTLLIENGIDKFWESTNQGLSWSAL